MLSLLRFLGRRVLVRAGSRSRLVSRALVVLGVVRWMRTRPRGRRVLNLDRGDTLVVGLQKNGSVGR